MIPRKRIDIGWADLASGVLACMAPGDAAAVRADMEAAWDARASLACLSVRSGFDALLGTLALPRGSEVLMSAVNIADMARIIEAHGLTPVPVDIDMQTLALSMASLTRAATPRTRAVLVAHLFGSRMPMPALVEFAHKNKYLLIEDCAQGDSGDGWRGEARADVSLFSFGVVKPATALGGALLSFRDAALCQRVRAHMASWPLQPRAAYLARLLKYAALVPFGNARVFGALVALCRWCGVPHEKIVAGAVRGFSDDGFFAAIRRRPAPPLLRLLNRRLLQGEQVGSVRRIANARKLQALLSGARCIGTQAVQHRHWMFPLVHEQGDALIEHLAARGFDAAHKASSIGVLAPPPGCAPAAEATHAFCRLIYLPAHEGMSGVDIERLADAMAEFDRQHTAQSAGALKVP